MKVYIKNKIISIGRGSYVTDENGNKLYNIKGKIFTITNKKFVCDANGNKLFVVKNKLFNFFVHKAYVCDASGKKIAMVKDKLFNVHNQFFVEGFKDEISFEGKFFHLTSQVIRNGEVIGILRRNITIIRDDAFELEADEADIPFLVALIIAIDNIVDEKTKT